jgi:hypothetical protein
LKHWVGLYHEGQKLEIKNEADQLMKKPWESGKRIKDDMGNAKTADGLLMIMQG